jgi:hypothetical protein
MMPPAMIQVGPADPAGVSWLYVDEHCLKAKETQIHIVSLFL